MKEAREHLEDNIVVWMTQVSTSQDAVPFLESRLDAHDRERAARFRFAEDRARYVLGRALVRKCLGHYLAQTPETIELTTTDRGRPILARDATIHFSITHTHDFVAVALTADAQVGIDLEFVQPKLNLLDLAERILSANDFRAFQALPDSEKQPAFFRIWTRKEAYLKARGEGISEGLQQISVSFGSEQVTHLKDERDESAARKWRMHALSLPADYMGCLACDDAAKRIDFKTLGFDESGRSSFT